MGRKIKILSFIVVFALAGLLIYSYYHVSGRALGAIDRMGNTTDVVIRKSYHTNPTAYEEFHLNEAQKEMLKELLIRGDFTRVLSTWVHFEDQEIYDIIIQDPTQGLYLIIHAIGGEYISIPDQFDGKFLKIHDPHWKVTLEEIIGRKDSQ